METLPADLCITRLNQQAERLGVEVRTFERKPSETVVGYYVAKPGEPGHIELHTHSTTAPKKLCQLLTHEMVHVLQHWHADWKAVLPLGWPTNGTAAQQRRLSPHEAEAFTAQDQPRKVLQALKQLAPVPANANPPSNATPSSN